MTMGDWFILIALFLLIIMLAYFIDLRNGMMRMNATLERIAKQLGVPDLLTPEILNGLKAFIVEGRKTEAMKNYRKLTGAGLKEASDFIEKLRDNP